MAYEIWNMKYDDDGRIFMVKSLSYGVLMGFFVLVHHIQKNAHRMAWNLMHMANKVLLFSFVHGIWIFSLE